MPSIQGNNQLGNDIFRATNLVVKALREIDAMFHQLDGQFPDYGYSTDENFREIDPWETRYYIEDPDGWTVLGILKNYAVRGYKEKRGKEPKKCLTVFAQLAPGITEDPNEGDQLLAREPLVHVLYNNEGPWDNSEEPVWLNQNALTENGYQLAGDNLWWYTEDGYHGWFYSAPLTEIRKPEDLLRIIVKPASKLLTSLNKLPSETEIQNALGANQSVIRYALNDNYPRIWHPSRLSGI